MIIKPDNKQLENRERDESWEIQSPANTAVRVYGKKHSKYCLAMNVMMNVDVYDKTKYLESAVFVFVREGGREGAGLYCQYQWHSAVCSVTIILTSIPHHHQSPGLGYSLTQLEPMTKSQLQRPILYQVKLFLGSECCHSRLIEAGHECSCLESDKKSFWSHLHFVCGDLMDYKHKYINILIIMEDHPTRILTL